MRIAQYTYFALSSETVHPDDIASAVGLDPDRADIRGNRFTIPKPVPTRNSWEIYSEARGRTVDEQLDEVAARIEPIKKRIRAFMDSAPDVAARFQVVRNFDDEAGEEEELPFDPVYGEKVPGQHQLLGWDLSVRLMRLMTYLDAPLNVDEYG